jgi:hypothetical protein
MTKLSRPGVSASIRAVVLLLATTFLASVLPRTLAAAAPTDEDRARQAVAMALEGKALQEKGRHQEALKLLEEAWAVSPHPKILFYKGRSLVALKRYDEAQLTYKLIRRNVADLEQDKLAEVDRTLAWLEDQLKETLVRFEAPGLNGVAVKVDGVALGSAPVKRTFKRGTYTVRAEREGYLAADASFSVLGEAEKTVKLELKPLPVRVEARPGEGATPPAAVTAPPSSTTRTWAWVTLGTGAAALATGGVLLGNYAVQAGKDLAPNQHLAGQSLDLGLGCTLAVAGAALVGTSVALFVKDARARQVPAVSLVPLPGGGALVVGW